MRSLPALIEHLWVSTLFLAMVLALLVLLRGRLTAAARFTLALIGILKFAIPAGPLVQAVSRLSGGTASPALFELPAQAAGVFQMSLTPAPASRWPLLLLGLWFVTAAMILLRFTLTRHRLVRHAVQTAQPATPREVAALTRARSRMKIVRGIDIARSSVSEGPAVLRIVRPLVVLPASGCEELSDAELEALLCHECAHVRRHDNLIARIESLICAFFWFHPLIWIAQRITVIDRERACDEAVAESADERETYTAALAKFCHAAIVPRLPGVSCMATARLKERMDHMENYETLKAQAPSPARITAVAVAALLAYTVLAGLAGSDRALAVSTTGGETAYAVKLTAVRKGDAIEMAGRVTDNATQTVVASPAMKFIAGTEATARAGNTEEDVEVVFRTRPGAAGDPIVVDVTVEKSGRRTFARTLAVTPTDATAAQQRKYTGAPITMNLKDADLRDVLTTFGKLTGLIMTIDDEIQGRISVSWTDVPWDQALDEILRDHALEYRLEGNAMQITKR